MVGIIFGNISVQKKIEHHSKILTYDIILAENDVSFWPKMAKFHIKWHILTCFTHLMTFMDNYCNINMVELMFRRFEDKNFFTTSLKFYSWGHFSMTQNLDQNDNIGRNWGVLVKQISSKIFKYHSYHVLYPILTIKIIIKGVSIKGRGGKLGKIFH